MELLLIIMMTELENANFIEAKNQIHAQITVESSWRPNICSIFACGLAQFTEDTWTDISPLTNPSCKNVPRENPDCSIRAQIVYISKLLRRYNETHSRRDGWLFAWAAYNGGPGWINREIRICAKSSSCDETKWFENVASLCHPRRADWACKENREYPLKILREMEKL